MTSLSLSPYAAHTSPASTKKEVQASSDHHPLCRQITDQANNASAVSSTSEHEADLEVEDDDEEAKSLLNIRDALESQLESLQCWWWCWGSMEKHRDSVVAIEGRVEFRSVSESRPQPKYNDSGSQTSIGSGLIRSESLDLL